MRSKFEFVDRDGTPTVIGLSLVLSRRNLRALLAKLNDPQSARTLQCHDLDTGIIISAIAEEDDVHYSHPSRMGEPAGEVHDRTLAAMPTIESTELSDTV
jgi:hypothetical protein